MISIPEPAISSATKEEIHIDDTSIRKFANWFNEFYSNPENCQAYAAWCNKNGLENDLTAPTWRNVPNTILTREEKE